MASSLGIDIGTTSISFAVVDGNEVIYTSSSCNSSALKENNDYQNADIIFETVKDETDKILKNYKIESIGFTGQMHGIVYTDDNGLAVSPLYTWKTQTGNLIYKNGYTFCDYIFNLTGKRVSTGYGLVTEFVNLKTNNFHTGKICTIGDYTAMRFCGNHLPTVHSSNAASFGFYDCSKKRFDAESLSKLGISTEILPEITNDRKIIGEYKGVPVCVSIGDNQASFMGSVEKGNCLINIGTGGQVSVRTLNTVEDLKNGIELRPFNGDEYLLVYSSLCGGRAYALLERFVRDIFSTGGYECKNAYDILNKSAVQTYLSRTDLKTSTLFSGTRQNPDKRAEIKDITENNFKIGDISLSFLEGIADEICTALNKIEKIIDSKQNIIFASGNGIQKNNLLRQIFEEKLGRKLILSSYKEEAAVGAAKFAGGYSV